jgi:hypothetical protein
MGKFIDITGRKFGRLVVLKVAGRNKNQETTWLCLCQCGTQKVVCGSHLRGGYVKSCGCLNVELIKKRFTTHGLIGTPIYRSWAAMLSRCRNPKDQACKHYGGRGIHVCGRWQRFENFFTDMGEKPKGLTIERINNDKGYFPANCKWATATEQVRNRRINKNNRTGIVGASWNKWAKKYVATIGAGSKQIHLGYFDNLKDATEARWNGEFLYW